MAETDGHVTLSNLAYRNQLNQELRTNLRLQFEQINTEMIRKNKKLNLHYYLYNMPTKDIQKTYLTFFLDPINAFANNL